jgi:polyhydroxyalkanoate synthesis regulator phasin
VSDEPEKQSGAGVGDALREAVDRTLRATSGSSALTRERAGELLDEVARRGRATREGIARRGQEAGAELAEAGAGLARRGRAAGTEVARRLEALERRLASIEDELRTDPDRPGGVEAPVAPEATDEAAAEGTDAEEAGSVRRPKPKAEG